MFHQSSVQAWFPFALLRSAVASLSHLHTVNSPTPPPPSASVIGIVSYYTTKTKPSGNVSIYSLFPHLTHLCACTSVSRSRVCPGLKCVKASMSLLLIINFPSCWCIRNISSFIHLPSKHICVFFSLSPSTSYVLFASSYCPRYIS